MIAAFISEVEQRYLARRSAALDAELLALHVARNEEQCSAGPVMAPASGRWEIPAPALDEERLRCLAKACGGARPVLFVLPSPGPGPPQGAAVCGGEGAREGVSGPPVR